VPRSEGPEEFFKVLREVQQEKSKHEGRPPGAEPALAFEPDTLPAGTLCLSYLAALGSVVIVVLLVILAYLFGRQHGWWAYDAALKRQAERAAQKATSAAPVQPPPLATEPEVLDGLVFTLVTLGKAPADRASVEKEAEFLNKYAPFKALQVEAYAWRDRGGRYRLCARGFKGMDEATRKQVRDKLRSLSPHGKGRRDYQDSDFLPQ